MDFFIPDSADCEDTIGVTVKWTGWHGYKGKYYTDDINSLYIQYNDTNIDECTPNYWAVFLETSPGIYSLLDSCQSFNEPDCELIYPNNYTMNFDVKMPDKGSVGDATYNIFVAGETDSGYCNPDENNVDIKVSKSIDLRNCGGVSSPTTTTTKVTTTTTTSTTTTTNPENQVCFFNDDCPTGKVCDSTYKNCTKCDEYFGGEYDGTDGRLCEEACGASSVCDEQRPSNLLGTCGYGSMNRKDYCGTFCYFEDRTCDPSCPGYTGDSECDNTTANPFSKCEGNILKTCDWDCKYSEESCTEYGLKYICGRDRWGNAECVTTKYPYVSIEYSYGVYYLDDYLDFTVNSFDDVSGIDIINLETLTCNRTDCGPYINYYHDCEGSTWCNYTFNIKLNETGSWQLNTIVSNKGGYTNIESDYRSATVLPKEEKSITTSTSTSTITSTSTFTSTTIIGITTTTATTATECTYNLDCCISSGQRKKCVDGICKSCTSGETGCFTCPRYVPASIVSLLDMIINFFKNIFGLH